MKDEKLKKNGYKDFVFSISNFNSSLLCALSVRRSGDKAGLDKRFYAQKYFLENVISTNQTKGYVDGDVRIFKGKLLVKILQIKKIKKNLILEGIPFALPPVGQNRWTSPVEHPSWENTRDTLQFAPDCVNSYGSTFFAKNTSEDCLYLNVYASVESFHSSISFFFRL